MAEISKIKKETEEKMKMAIEFLDETFARIRYFFACNNRVAASSPCLPSSLC
jgi:ribosome recycling factor